MPPEYNTYLVSPHARVMRRLPHRARLVLRAVRSQDDSLQAAVGDAHRELRVPNQVSSMRPARDTCELCHYPKFSDDSLRILNRYRDNEDNDPYAVYLLMHTGGGTQREGWATAFTGTSRTRWNTSPPTAWNKTFPGCASRMWTGRRPVCVHGIAARSGWRASTRCSKWTASPATIASHLLRYAGTPGRQRAAARRHRPTSPTFARARWRLSERYRSVEGAQVYRRAGGVLPRILSDVYEDNTAEIDGASTCW